MCLESVATTDRAKSTLSLTNSTHNDGENNERNNGDMSSINSTQQKNNNNSSSGGGGGVVFDPYGPLTGQLMATMKEAIFDALQISQLRLVEAMFKCDVQTTGVLYLLWVLQL